MLLPRMLLRPLTRGGRVTEKVLESNCDKFLAFNWEDPLQISPPPRHPQATDHRSYARRAALNLVRMGKLSRAAKALNSSGLAPANETTRASWPLSTRNEAVT